MAHPLREMLAIKDGMTIQRFEVPTPPPVQAGPTIHADPKSGSQIEHWLEHYWAKLELPTKELNYLAITQDRQEFMQWSGKRLNLLILGCYCYLPASLLRRAGHLHEQANNRHLIFIEPDTQAKSIEVTVAHELIHLADRVKGTPRRHRHHGHDSIAADEAAITGYELEDLRQLLREEGERRERIRRERRPLRYTYECPNCGKEYLRARRYSQAVSCSSCDRVYNPSFQLALRDS